MYRSFGRHFYREILKQRKLLIHYSLKPTLFLLFVDLLGFDPLSHLHAEILFFKFLMLFFIEG